jgi:hypothetical protein
MRYLTTVLLAGLCLSCATAPKAAPVAAVVSPPAATDQRGPVIARICRRNQIIVIRAGAAEATYSLETARGEVLLPGMTLGQLAQKKPELFQAVRNMQASDMWAGGATQMVTDAQMSAMPSTPDFQQSGQQLIQVIDGR